MGDRFSSRQTHGEKSRRAMDSQLSTTTSTFDKRERVVRSLPSTMHLHNSRHDFDVLVEKIRECLGQDAGIDTSDQHLDELISALKHYQSVDTHWSKFALRDASRAYTRNLVDECNGNANLLVLVWNPGKSSPAHCHSNAHCLMKILSGTLQETLYDWPAGATPMEPREATKEDIAPKRPQHESQMVVKRQTTLHRDEVTYISDALGVHRIGNPSTTEVAISLHLYTPPWAAK